MKNVFRSNHELDSLEDILNQSSKSHCVMAMQEVQWHAIDNMDFDAGLTKVPII